MRVAKYNDYDEIKQNDLFFSYNKNISFEQSNFTQETGGAQRPRFCNRDDCLSRGVRNQMFLCSSPIKIRSNQKVQTSYEIDSFSEV